MLFNRLSAAPPKPRSMWRGVAVVAVSLASLAGCSRKVDGAGVGASATQDVRREKVQAAFAPPKTYTVQRNEGTSDVADIYRRALTHFDRGDVAGARAAYTQALAHEPGNPQAHIGLAACAMHDNDLGKARSEYERALELHPRSTLARIGLGSVAYVDKKYDEAAKHYEAALVVDETNADAHWGAATSYAQLGDHDRVRPHAKRFLELAPDSTLRASASDMLGKDP